MKGEKQNNFFSNQNHSFSSAAENDNKRLKAFKILTFWFPLVDDGKLT